MEIIVAGAIFLLTLIPRDDGNSAPPTPSPAVSKTPEQEASPTPTPKVQPKTHTVEAGQTLFEIAKKYYGSGAFWTTLWNDNPKIEDPRVVHAGLVLKIRENGPEEAEELNDGLAIIYEELTASSPTPSPKPPQTAVAGAQGVSFDEIYHQAGEKYGVPWEILYGLHQMETGGRDGAISSGYGTGAQGPLQFMPGTWASYGVDGNGDGVADINSAVDAIYGAANFIAAHGGVEQGLRSYGGDSNLVLSYARSRGWSQ